MEQKSAFDSFELEIGSEVKGFLKETASWTYFLSILGFIGIGLMVLFGLFFGSIMSSRAFGGVNPYESAGMSMGFFGIVYVVMALLYFFPVMYLFNFSRKMKAALQSQDNTEFISAFSNMKSHYKFLGIFAIVILSIYLLLFIFGAGSAML